MEIVSALRSVLADKVGRERYELWFGESTELALHPDRLVVTAPTRFFQEWLRRNFREQIEAASLQVLGRQLELEFQVGGAAPAKAKAESAATTQRPTPTQGSAPQVEAPALLALPGQQATKAATGRRFARLDSFVVGDCNRLAYTTAQLAISRLGHWSPLVVHGPTGVGKTHLLEGIWSGVRQSAPSATTVYLTAEQFTSYFLEALRGSGLPNFRRKYRGVDLLIIDDIQFFAGKRATLIELLYTVNSLQDEGRQIVLAADRSLAELDELGKELINRLNGGVVCRMEAPDYETRLGIVRGLAAKFDTPIPDEVCCYIATHLTSHARELSGAINRLHATHLAHGQPIALAMAQEALGELIRTSGRHILLRDIEEAVCDVFGLEKQSLQSGRRSKEVSNPRMLAMWLARKHTRAALSEIGHYFGRRSHSTVISAQRKVGNWMQHQETLHLANGRCSIEEAVRRVERKLQVG